MNETPSTYLPDRDHVIEKKAGILSWLGHESEYLLDEAEVAVENMKQSFGSLEAVDAFLNYEIWAKHLGIFEDIESFSQEALAQATDELQKDMPQIMAEAVSLSRELQFATLGEYATLVANHQATKASERIVMAILDRLAQSGKLPPQDQAIAMLMPLQNFYAALLYRQFQPAIIHTLQETAGIPPVSPLSPEEEAAARLKHTERYLEQTLANNNGTPPPTGGSPRINPVKERLLQLARERQLVTSSEPPPPPDWIPESYKEVIPRNLEEIVWENGDALRIRPAKILKDDEGRERQFYYLTYQYTPQGRSEPVSIDLSNYISGKVVLFEGTEGALTGAALSPYERKNYLGWALNIGIPETNTPYLVALNVEHLRQSPLSISTVFHELGHVYLFGTEELKVLQNRAHKLLQHARNWFSKKSPRVIRGIEHYQKEVDVLRDTLVKRIRELQGREQALRAKEHTPRYVTETTPTQLLHYDAKEGWTYRPGPPQTRLVPAPPMTDQERRELEAIQNEVAAANNLYLILHKPTTVTQNDLAFAERTFPEIKLLMSIFHERMVSAFAVRQLRHLRPELIPSMRDVLASQHQSLRAYAKRYDDPRYIHGLKPKGE